MIWYCIPVRFANSYLLILRQDSALSKQILINNNHLLYILINKYLLDNSLEEVYTHIKIYIERRSIDGQQSHLCNLVYPV